MTGRPFAESQKIREWIQSAVGDGARNPTRVMEWIAQRKAKNKVPSLATISRIMREEMNFEPATDDWTQKGKDD